MTVRSRLARTSAHRARERRQRRRALSAENDALRELYQHAPAACVTLDRTGRVVEANKTAERVLGVAPRALIRAPLHMYLSLADRAVLTRHVEQVLDSARSASCQITFERTPGVMRLVAQLDSIAVRDALGRSLCRTAITGSIG